MVYFLYTSPMQKHSTSRREKPVTVNQLKSILKQAFAPIHKRFEIIDKRFAQIDKQFKQIDTKFEVTNGKLAAFVGINALNIDRAIRDLEERQNKQFDKIFSKMDAFLKRTEENEREVLLLGKQHDNLANYCTEKMGYPVYGRNIA